MTPQQHMEYFRKHFQLTMEQAAYTLNIPKKDWRNMERGTKSIPKTFQYRLVCHTKRFLKLLHYHTQWCPGCKKNILKWWEKGHNACPYCSRELRRPLKQRIREILPTFREFIKEENIPWIEPK